MSTSNKHLYTLLRVYYKLYTYSLINKHLYSHQNSYIE